MELFLIGFHFLKLCLGYLRFNFHFISQLLGAVCSFFRFITIIKIIL